MLRVVNIWIFPVSCSEMATLRPSGEFLGWQNSMVPGVNLSLIICVRSKLSTSKNFRAKVREESMTGREE